MAFVNGRTNDGGECDYLVTSESLVAGASSHAELKPILEEKVRLEKKNKFLRFLVGVLGVASIALGCLASALVVKLYVTKDRCSDNMPPCCVIPDSFDIIPPAAVITPTRALAVNHTIAKDSAAYYNGSANVNRSPYYKVVNFYVSDDDWAAAGDRRKGVVSSESGNVGISLELEFNSSPTRTLQILKKFRTYQQTSAYSCGAAVGFMALRHLGVENVTEGDIAIAAKTAPVKGTTTVNLAKGLEKLLGIANDTRSTDAAQTSSNQSAFEVTYQAGNGNMTWGEFILTITSNIAANRVMCVANNGWGPHWTAIIGYDSMGTKETADDVLIIADPFDTTDQWQDGYLIMSAERFFSTWVITSSVFGEEHALQQFVTVGKKKKMVE